LASTWTTDPSGTLYINATSLTPTVVNAVVILTGRTISTTGNNRQSASLEIREGGILDLAANNGHNFGAVSGKGTLRISQNNYFPAGTYTSFVSSSGGTVQYFNFSGILSNTQTTYNNLLLTKTDNNAANYTLTLASNLVLNGNLTLTRTQGTGILNFILGNDNTVRTIAIKGSVFNNAGCWIGVGVFNAIHTITLFGDLTNNGTIRLTNRTLPWNNNWYNCVNLTTTGAADMFFMGSANNVVTCNGTTDFHRFVVDKGMDQTYMLDVYSSNVNNFRLWAPDNYGPGATQAAACGSTNWSPISTWKNLFIANGTLRLNANITIPSLTEGGQDFNIAPSSELWINGADVTTTTNLNGTGYTATTLAGTLRISSGSFSTGGSAGFVLGNGLTPTVLIEGGTLDISQIWTANGTGTNISFIQTGGIVNVRANGEAHGSTFFELSLPDCAFKMTGGTINITNGQHSDGTWLNRIFDIRSDTRNIDVTGGTININLKANTFDIISSTPFYNTTITRASGAANLVINLNNTIAPSFTILNNLTINGNCELSSSASNVNLSVGGGFTLNAGAIYTPNNNTTTFNGKGGQVLTNTGTITTGLYKMTLSGASNTIITNNLTLRNDLTINAGCDLGDQGFAIFVAGNIYNSGLHSSQANGSIILTGSGNPTTIGGNGNGSFGNVTINKSAGYTSLTSTQALTGDLRLGANGLLDINSNKLNLSAQSEVYDDITGTTKAGFSGTKMIRTSGAQSDGGLTKTYNSTTPVLFPLGTGVDYTPAIIQFAIAPDIYGSVNVKPVARLQPFITSNNSLDYYWKVTGAGFSGIKPASLRHTYTFIDADWTGHGNIINYVPGRYNPSAWSYINDVAQVADATNSILFTNVGYLDGDFTAGQTDAFGSVLTYYSRSSGDWNNVNTWSADPILKWNGAPAGSIPGATNPVIIGDGTIHNHTITVSVNGRRSGTLQISSNSILDLGTTINHDFGALPIATSGGNGTLRISSATATAVFPAGDFGSFLGNNGGTVEYYSTGVVDFTMPTIANYWNLNSNPSSGRTITMANVNLSVLNNLTILGAGVANINSAGARTLTVEGLISVNAATFRFLNNQAQSIIAKKDILIGATGRFDVSNAGAAVANNLTVFGNLTNNGIIDLNPDNVRYCDVIFTGNTNNVITGTGGTSDFNRLTVDKGISRSSVLNITSSAFSLSNNTLATSLFLPNGTFRLTSNLTITLSTNGPFTIPSSGCLSANGGTINIGTAANDNGDLLLAGCLEVLAGNLNIGVAANNSNNDIEYAPAGSPAIIIQGGNLFVNGQIRRNTNNTLGSLLYNQSGGTVTINGQNQNAVSATRAKFEITNDGSNFVMSGGNLVIVRAGGINYGDLYITPELSNITGGTIQVGNAGTPAGQVFILNSSSPLWSLTIDGTTNPKTLNLQVNKLVLKNNLSIHGSSVFLANGLNINIGGNLTNQNPASTVGLSTGGYQTGLATQITTFDGMLNNQTLTGVAGNLTNFANVEIKNTFSPGRLTLAANTNVRINNDLKITSGILNDGGNPVTVLGHLSNSAVHESPAGNGIILAGPSRQEISGNGNGQFGNININNINDVYLVDNATINNNLTFTSGNLYIDDYLLTFGTNALVTGATAGLPTRMIMLNGALSDAGVRKIYPAIPSSFTFPLGIAGKYTPVTINLTSNTTAGNITVKPVNSQHPSLQNAIADELKYYWSIVSNGFGAVTATQTFNYINGDVTGTETNYTTGRYYGGDWVPAGGLTGTVNAAINTITLTGINYIDGEYTAGEPANFATMPTYYSRNLTLGGDWDNPASWSTTGHAGAAAASTPNGNKVIIANGHTITVNTDLKKAYSIDLYGSLNLGTTVYHNFGHVTGNGIIRLTSTSADYFVFPGGHFDVFMNTTGSTVEFTNNSANPATFPSEVGHIYKPFQNVIFSGAGVKAMTSKNMKVLGNLTITSGTLSNSLANRNICLLGNWNDNVASGFVPGYGLVSFEGSAAQTVNATITENFYNLQVNNSAGVTLNRPVNTSNLLYLLTGKINTTATNILKLTSTNPNSVSGGSTASFVNGPMAKMISNGSFFNFPVGSGSRYGNVYISNTVTGTQMWVAEYINNNPLIAAMDPALKLTPIDVVSNNEYWRINGATATQAVVRIRWDSSSSLVPPDAFTRSQKMRIVEWNGAAWLNRGGVINDGGVSSGTVQSSTALNLVSNHYFTLGIESLPTATITGGTTNICNNGSNANIPIALTGVAPWAIKYKINGANETTITNIGSTPFNIVANSADLFSLGGGPGYTFTISYVSDASSSVGTRDFVTSATVTVLAAPSPVITGKASVSQNEIGVQYNVVSFSGHTYNWVVTGATSFTGQGTNQITVNWGAGAAGNVSVTETLTVTGCSSTDNQNIVINIAPTPVVAGNNSVCDQTDEIYNTPSAVVHTFNWTVTGGIISLGQGTNQITVHWNLPGSRTVTVRETITSTGAFADNILSVDEHALPSAILPVSDPQTCIGIAANIIISGGEAGTDYTLRLHPVNTVVTTIHNGSAGNVTFTVSPIASTNYNVYATNEYGCSTQLTDLSTVTVNAVPVIGPVNSINNLTLR